MSTIYKNKPTFSSLLYFKTDFEVWDLTDYGLFLAALPVTCNQLHPVGKVLRKEREPGTFVLIFIDTKQFMS